MNIFFHLFTFFLIYFQQNSNWLREPSAEENSASANYSFAILHYNR